MMPVSRMPQSNFFREAHRQDIEVWQFRISAGIDARAAIRAIEAVVPGKRLWYQAGRPDLHGYINTGSNPDGSTHVYLCIYRFSCPGADCPVGVHPPFVANSLGAGYIDAIARVLGAV